MSADRRSSSLHSGRTTTAVSSHEHAHPGPSRCGQLTPTTAVESHEQNQLVLSVTCDRVCPREPTACRFVAGLSQRVLVGLAVSRSRSIAAILPSKQGTCRNLGCWVRSVARGDVGWSMWCARPRTVVRIWCHCWVVGVSETVMVQLIPCVARKVRKLVGSYACAGASTPGLAPSATSRRAASTAITAVMP